MVATMLVKPNRKMKRFKTYICDKCGDVFFKIEMEERIQCPTCGKIMKEGFRKNET